MTTDDAVFFTLDSKMILMRWYVRIVVHHTAMPFVNNFTASSWCFGAAGAFEHQFVVFPFARWSV